MSSVGAPPFVPSETDAYRVIAEDVLLEQFLISAWRREVLAGHRAEALDRVAQSLERFIALGLPFRREGTTRLFDPVEVSQCSRIAFLRGLDDTWSRDLDDLSARNAANRDEMAAARRAVHAGHSPAPRRYQVSLRRDFHFESASADGIVRRFVAVPSVGPDQPFVSVDIRGTSAETSVIMRKDVVELRHPMSAGEDAWVDMLWTIETSCRVGQDRATDAPPRECPDPRALASRDDGWVNLTPALCQLADEVAGTDRDPHTTIERLWEFVATLRLGAIHTDLLDANDPLMSAVRSGSADCFVATSLLVSMLRARGIPARIQRGCFLSVRPTQHFWLEAWLPPGDWVPFDTLSMMLSVRDPISSPWARYFYGALDFRCVIDRYPRSVAARNGTPLPRRRYSTQKFCERGSDTSYFNLDTRALLYRDRIDVESITTSVT